MRYAICFFPAVGVLCGAALWLWTVVAQVTSMSGVLFAAIAALLIAISVTALLFLAR